MAKAATGLPGLAGSPAPGIQSKMQTLQRSENSRVGAEVYSLRLAKSADEVRRAQELRYNIFNVELGEGLAESKVSGLDRDAFDEICDHLIVEHLPTGSIVGTYRLQTGRRAAEGLGYYSEIEFDFRPFESVRGELVELGRACVDRAHRNLMVIGALWRGVAAYAKERGCRYLCGCSSLNSQDPATGASVYAELMRRHLAAPEFRTRPQPGYECSLLQLAEEAPPVPKLLRAYLSFGAKICGAPALDREFKTIDFLTLMDLGSISESTKERLFR